jgi:ferric-dicitrate binding protein FerR (iron transport regulator)
MSVWRYDRLMQRADAAVDRQIQDWLSVLKDGSPAAKVVARRGLAQVCEARGLLEEATDLVTANVAAGAPDPDTLRWLARLYAARGDHERSRQAADEASRLMAARYPARNPSLPPTAPTRRGRRLSLAGALLLTAAGVGAAIGWIMTLLLATGAR